jgi:hypothetical protein
MGVISKQRGKVVVGEASIIGNTGLDVNDLAVNALQKAQRVLTAAEVKALYTTPLALVAAPGAGKVISVVEVFAKYVFGTTAFTGSNNLEFRYTSSSGAKVTADIDAALLLAASGTNYRKVSPIEAEITPVANAPIVIGVPTGNPAQGLGALTITVYYRTITP